MCPMAPDAGSNSTVISGLEQAHEEGMFLDGVRLEYTCRIPDTKFYDGTIMKIITCMTGGKWSEYNMDCGCECELLTLLSVKYT